MPETILIAEDDAFQREILGKILTNKLGYRVLHAANGSEALSLVQASNLGDIDAVLLDIHMPVMDGFQALKAIRACRGDIPVLMLTGSDDVSLAVQAIREGATDFLTKPPELAHLDVSIKNAIKINAMAQEIVRLKRDKQGAMAFTDLVGHHAGLADAVAYGRKAAASNVPVLIMGETGVGKELFARAIHGESRRVAAPFIALNCGAIPENLVESTLFGHEKGAFTGATNRTIGKFREAEGGTIFLDEIGELPLEAQVKLLRVLQQKEVEPVGASRALPVDVRVISATNRDLAREVAAGRFREDLYFRLNVLKIIVPPLRERPQDILLLANAFLERLAAADKLAPKTLSRDGEAYLLGDPWRGNVRELQNLLHRALVLADSDVIDHALLYQLHEAGSISPLLTERRAAPPLHLNLRDAEGQFKPMETLEMEIMQMALVHFDHNIPRAAEALAMAKSTFYRKVKG